MGDDKHDIEVYIEDLIDYCLMHVHMCVTYNSNKLQWMTIVIIYCSHLGGCDDFMTCIHAHKLYMLMDTLCSLFVFPLPMEKRRKKPEELILWLVLASKA